MFDIFVTFAVLKLERSSEDSLLQSWNMNAIFVTFAVLKLERVSEERLLQPLNMDDIFVTFAVLNELERVSEESL